MLPSLGPLLEAAERAKKVGSSSDSSSPGRSAPTPPQKALQQPQLHFQPTPLPDFVQQTLSQQGAPMYMQMGAPQHIHGLNASMMVGGMGASMAPMGGLMLEGGRQVAGRQDVSLRAKKRSVPKRKKTPQEEGLESANTGNWDDSEKCLFVRGLLRHGKDWPAMQKVRGRSMGGADTRTWRVQRR